MARIRTVEYEPYEGWIARCPWSGFEITEPGFRWNSRSVARAIVNELRILGRDEEWEARQLDLLRRATLSAKETNNV